ncbi:MAG: hypothetical protein LBH32_05660, partial [Dysgonamonadaceae bacterium]|nr:hypothetical protein [Dysgonamonadaceae bacterium]
LLRKTATLQILLNRAEQKQRSCNIFVAVCVSARLENTDRLNEQRSCDIFFNSKLYSALHGFVQRHCEGKA